ncbi:hypothetical protein C0993_012663 [Termitomyces sp. T159_Od127]|nr:hypothetical protein C0993_012663 [Termitomyces sp. T159_Od127]
MVAKKGKHCEAPPIDNDSNYRELQSEEEEEEEEGKTPAPRFQHVQQNKKITKKKVNKAKATAALAHQVLNNFSGHIPNELGVKVDDERLECLEAYGTSAAIPHWDRWHKMSKEDYYCLLFKCAKEGMVGLLPEATGLYYYIGMDPNVGQLWKQTPAHDTTAAGGLTTPPRKDSKPLLPTINIATGEEAKMTDMGRSPPSV